MARRFKKVDYEKSLEQTITIREVLPDDHLERFIVAVIGLLDLGAIYTRYGPVDREAYAPEKTTALDNAYFSQTNIEALQERGIDPYIAPGRDCHHKSRQERFISQPTPPHEDCQCDGQDGLQAQSDIGKLIYCLRKSTVEPVIAIIKEVLGFRQSQASGAWCACL